MGEVTQEMPRALLEQSCCIGLIGKNVVIDCETRVEAEEVLDWLCDGRTAQATALAAKEAELAELRDMIATLGENAAKAAKEYSELIAAERAKVEKLREVLANLVEEYTMNVDSFRTGGFYTDPETEEVIIEARAALAETHP